MYDRGQGKGDSEREREREREARAPHASTNNGQQHPGQSKMSRSAPKDGALPHIELLWGGGGK